VCENETQKQRGLAHAMEGGRSKNDGGIHPRTLPLEILDISKSFILYHIN
jgi:hypothetical protein